MRFPLFPKWSLYLRHVLTSYRAGVKTGLQIAGVGFFSNKKKRKNLLGDRSGENGKWSSGCYIVHFVFTPTQSIQYLQYETTCSIIKEKCINLIKRYLQKDHRVESHTSPFLFLFRTLDNISRTLTTFVTLPPLLMEIQKTKPL